jgi:hypothetical protein
MRRFWSLTLVACAVTSALAVAALRALTDPAYSEAALARFDAFHRLVGVATYGLPAALLALAASEVRRRPLHGLARELVLWAPFSLFVCFSFVGWWVLGDARIHYLQHHGRWEGGFSGALFFAFLQYPVAGLLNAVVASWARGRGGRTP